MSFLSENIDITSYMCYNHTSSLKPILCQMFVFLKSISRVIDNNYTREEKSACFLVFVTRKFSTYAFMKQKKKKLKIIIPIIVGLFLLILILTPSNPPPTTTYNEFLTKVEAGQVKTVKIIFKDATFVYEDIDGNQYTTDNPKTETFKEELLLKDVEVIEDTGVSTSVIVSLVSTLIYVGLIYILAKKLIPSIDTAEIVTSVPNINFDSVAGHKELRSDLTFIVDYLKNPKKYHEIGARMPKGIILCGPPGTGKTLTAKAIAGTAGVPFFYMSGSDFVELYVGNGARKVRKLYKKAKESAPCIVFIDEIDAVGGNRDNQTNNDEGRQTLNALLAELDGFTGNRGYSYYGGLQNKLKYLTQRLSVLVDSTKQILLCHCQKKKIVGNIKSSRKSEKTFSSDINWEEIAAMTVNLSGAAIEAILNEAAFIAASSNKKEIIFEDIERAFYKMILKGDWKENQASRDRKELEIVAWHEAGHALATKLLTNDSVPKVTILSSTSGAGGITFRTPQNNRLASKQYMKSLIKVLYSGRIAESIFLESEDEVTTGASNDIEQATLLIQKYISSYGMDDEIGLINLSAFKTFDNEIIIKKASEIAKELYGDRKIT